MWARDTGTNLFHTGSWALWLAAALLAALGTRNPIYLITVITVALIVAATMNRLASANNLQSRIAGLWRIVVAITIIVALLKGLSFHIGETILFTLPDWLPVIGGKITLEGIVAAALDGLALLTVLAVFAAFSAGADYYAMLRSIPSALHGAGLITSIAITFVPQTIERWREIREAQLLRGHRVRRVPDLLPLIIPLLAGGMERSLNLAEAMESRGFSRSTARAGTLPPILVQSGLAAGLGLILVGGTMFAFAPDAPLLGWLLILGGLLFVGLTLWLTGRGTQRTRYRRAFWRAHDTPLAIISIGVLAILLLFKFAAPALLAYTPFLRLSMPGFEPLIFLALCGLLAPAVIVRVGDQQPHTNPAPSNT